MTIGIIVAMEKEARLVEGILSREKETVRGWAGKEFKTGKAGGKNLILSQSGIGKANSAMTAQEMAVRFKPDFILNTGVAGGIDSSLSVMDIVVGKKTSYHDVDCGEGNLPGQIQGLPPFFEGDARLAGMLLGASSVRARKGLILSGDRFVSKEEELLQIKSAFPEGLAVDMESASIAQACHLTQTPFLSLRVISDIVGASGHAAQYKDFWKEAAETSFAAIREIISLA